MLLSVKNLEVCYGVISALQDVSLDVGRGEVVTLIGANGAGKTTLLRTISGLLTPARGTMLWNPQAGPLSAPDPARVRPFELERLRPHQIVGLGICHVPEGRQIFANLTVRENLMLGGYQRKSRDEVRADLDRCYSLFPVLAERREQRAGTLSGGEQQMLAIGRALMARPQLLLLDEPSLGLAPLIVRKIFQIIREINEQGTTVFLVEQNAHMALTIAHRAYVLQTGRVIKSDKAASLLEDPDVKKAYLGG
ncbi:MAG TPA: ABC transporter ATP-binding protein [Tepidisphaeraceae bacterium]|nr:ABC transporter ATP-binding protein [Tepidisphaeraceae bacterium]